MNKKAIQLSVNFLVIIILSIVIISFSVYILTTVVGKATVLSKSTQEDLDKRIESLQCSGQVCISVNYKQIERGEFSIFGLKVFNTGTGEDFILEVVPIREGLNYQPQTGFSFKVRQNDETRIGLGFEVPKNAESGIYIFNINVQKIGQEGIYGNAQQIRVEVP